MIKDPNDADKLYVGGGLWESGKQVPVILALQTSTGNQLWKWVSTSHSNHGAVRGVIVDGTDILSTGYIKSPTAGFLFWAEEATAAVWKLDTGGSLVTEKLLSQSYLPQGAKIRKDKQKTLHIYIS